MADTRTILINYESNIDEYNKQLEKLDKNSQEYNDTLEELEKEQKNYDKALIENAKNAKIFGTSFNDIQGALKGTRAAIKLSIKSLGAFKAALAATGIGLIVIALGALVAWMKRTQKGMNTLEDITDVLGNAVSALVGFFVDLVKAIATLDFKGITNSFKNLFTNIKDGTKDVLELNASIRDTEEATRSLARLTSILGAAIAENLVITKEVTAADKDRFEALRIATQQQKLLTAETIKVAQQNLKDVEEKIRLEQANNEFNDEQIQRRIDAQNRVTEAERDGANKLRELTNRRVELENSIRAKNAAIVAKAEADRLAKEKESFDRRKAEIEERRRIAQEQADFEAELAAEVDAEILKSDQELAKQQAAIRQQKAIDDARAAEFALNVENEKNSAIFAMTADLFGSLAGLAGQNTKFGKASAIAEATINSWLGVSGVWRAYANPLTPSFTVAGALVQTATVLASGLGAVKQILATPLPKVQVQESSFARGGMINGRSHAMGGVHIEAEGGEAIINKRSMAIPGVRQAASYLNELGGGLSFQSGGVVPQINNSSQIIDAINNAANQARIVLVTEDLDAVQNRVSVTEDRSTF